MFGDFVQWTDEVALNVVGQCLDGRDVDGVDFLFEFPFKSKPDELVNDGEKSRQCFTRARG